MYNEFIKKYFKVNFMDPITLVASVVSGLLVEAIKEGGKVLTKNSPKPLQYIVKSIGEKLQMAGTSGLLERLENNPNPRNIEILEGEILEQMNSDESFLVEIRGFLEQLKTEQKGFLHIQKVISDIENVENIQIGDIQQVSNASSSKLIIAEKIKDGVNIKIGNVTQNS